MKCDFAMRPADGIVARPVFGFDARWTVKDRRTRLPTEQEVAEITKDVAPEVVLKEIEQQDRKD